MRTILLFAMTISATSAAFAQPYTHNETMLAYHVKSVSEYEQVDGKRRLVRYNVYDSAGYHVLQQTVNYNNRKKNVVTDTFVFYNDSHFTRIAKEKNELYDSTVYRVSVGPDYDTTTEVTFKSGEVVNRVVHLESDLPHQTIYTGTSADPDTLIHTYAYKYDDQRRIIARDERSIRQNGESQKLHMAYGFIAIYDSVFIIHKHYQEDNQPYRASCTVYTSYDNKFDSTITYNADGTMNYTCVRFRDDKGRDTLSITTNGDGSLRYQTSIGYDKYDEVREHYDGHGLFKTVHVSYNENDMVISQKEKEVRTGKVRYVDFVYTYY